MNQVIKSIIVLQSYSRGAERMRKISVSGRLSQSRDDLEDRLSPLQSEIVAEHSSSAAADDSPDHQILMTPRNPKPSSGVDIQNSGTDSSNSSEGTKKDL